MKLWGWWRCEHTHCLISDGTNGRCIDCGKEMGYAWAEMQAMIQPPPLSRYMKENGL